MHYAARYEERHPTLAAANEAAMINSYEPKECPYCKSEKFVKIGYDTNGIRRYKCSCEKKFRPTTGTIFDSRTINEQIHNVHKEGLQERREASKGKPPSKPQVKKK